MALVPRGTDLDCSAESNIRPTVLHIEAVLGSCTGFAYIITIPEAESQNLMSNSLILRMVMSVATRPAINTLGDHYFVSPNRIPGILGDGGHSPFALCENGLAYFDR